MNKDIVQRKIDARCAKVAAWVVIDRKGVVCATIRAGYPQDGAGRLYVDVRHTYAGNEYCAKAPHCWAAITKAMREGMHGDYREVSRELFGYQVGAAGGYGYDKKTAALSGLIVCGHTLADHCGGVPEDGTKREALMKRYTRDMARPTESPNTRAEYWNKVAKMIGCTWSNWSDGKYNSLHFIPGLDRLAAFGFNVVQVI